MPIISPNAMQAVGEVFASHNITPQLGERTADALSRMLGLSRTEVERWLEALDQGCTPQQSSLRAGIARERANEPLMMDLARAIGTAIGKGERALTANRQYVPLKDQGDKLES